MQDERSSTPRSSATITLENRRDEEIAQIAQSPVAPTFKGDTELRSRRIGEAIARRLPFGKSSPTSRASFVALGPHLSHLIQAYQQSDIASEINRKHSNGNALAHGSATDIDAVASFSKASWWSQFKILSGRSFKNLYRNPMLMFSHYAVSILVAGQSKSPFWSTKIY